MDPALIMDDAIEIEDEAVVDVKSIDKDDKYLQHEYTFWCFMKSRADGDWKPKPLANFRSIKQFWNVYQFLKRPSQLEQGTMYNFFRKGIEPAWEDE